MFLTDLSIKRPVVSMVMSIVMVMFGILVFFEIPTNELPDIDRPVVSVQTDYKGASAQVIDTQITQKIEDFIGGTPGLVSIDSMSEDERSRIDMTFKDNLDIDDVANDVRSAISRVVDNLPKEASAPEIFKQSAGFRTTMWLSFSSDFMSDLELTDFADRYLVDYFSTVEGVGRVRLGGERQISVRVWLDPLSLAARNLTTQDVEQVLNSENLEFPAGRIESKDVDLSIKLENAYENLDSYKKLPLKRAIDGSVTTLEDVSRIEFGPVSTRTLFKGNGKKVVGIGIYQNSDANTIAVATKVKKKIKEIQSSIPDGSTLEVSFDRSNYVSNAIKEVYKTLFVALILVTLIIYLFLGNIRALVVPIVALPVSLISTFLAIYFFDFSINLFTLMALVLAIGIVVDDAIVMLENIYRRVEKGESSLVAAYKGSRQVSFAIIATTLVLVAVFIPLIFIEGLAGVLYAETAVTLSFAVIISSFVALSLSPMIASKVLDTRTKRNKLTLIPSIQFDFGHTILNEYIEAGNGAIEVEDQHVRTKNLRATMAVVEDLSSDKYTLKRHGKLEYLAELDRSSNFKYTYVGDPSVKFNDTLHTGALHNLNGEIGIDIIFPEHYSIFIIYERNHAFSTGYTDNLYIALGYLPHEDTEYAFSLNGSENLMSKVEIKKSMNGYDLSFNLNDDITNLGDSKEASINLNKVF